MNTSYAAHSIDYSVQGSPSCYLVVHVDIELHSAMCDTDDMK